MKPNEARAIWKKFGSERVKVLNSQGISRDTFIELAMLHGDAVFDAVEKNHEEKTGPVATDA